MPAGSPRPAGTRRASSFRSSPKTERSRDATSGQSISTKLSARVAEVHLHLPAGKLPQRAEAFALVEDAELLEPQVGGLEVVDLEAEVLVRVPFLLDLEDVQLEVAEPQPAHRGAEVRRRDPLYPEDVLVEAGHGIDVGGRDADVVDRRRAHLPDHTARREGRGAERDRGRRMASADHEEERWPTRTAQ